MKKHIIFIASLMLAVFAGCNEDPDIELYEPTDIQSLIVTLPTTTTRVGVTDGESSVSLNWDENDKFSVYSTDGTYVTDFIYSLIDSNDNSTVFVVDGSGATLVDKQSYIAVFPSADGATSLSDHCAAIEAKVTAQTQNGNNSKEHFNDHLLMESAFTYSASNSTSITFEHKMAAIRLTFEVSNGYTPTKVIFDDGSFASYTLNFSNTTSAEQYTANYVILPNEEGATRELKATIYASISDSTEMINDFSIESAAKYSAGVQYRSELSIADVTMDISTLADLIVFRDAVNSGSTALNANLLKDIDLGGSEDNQWIPIASLDSKYSGTFNGGGNKISGLYINSDTISGTSFFGSCDGATITDFTIEGSITNTAMEGAAAFVGFAYNSTLRNCSTTSATTINGMMNNTGGIVGYISATTIDSCTNNATIIGSRHVGGLAGYTSDARSSYISNSTNNGTVSDDNATSDKNSCVGGIVGTFQGLYGSITNNVNNGSVSCYYEYAGGIVGSSKYSDINNCYNTANVAGGKYCGGISGYFYSATVYGTAIINCYNSGNVYTVASGNIFYIGGISGMTYASRVANCYNIGNVGSSSNSWVIGGIVGWNYTSSTVYSCYNAATISSYYGGAQIVGTNGSSSSVTFCYGNSELTPTSLISSDENSSATITDSYTTEYMKLPSFVNIMNNAAYYYNLTSPNIKAYGWATSSDGYPVLDATVTPTILVYDTIQISSVEELAKIGVDSEYTLYDNYILTQSIDLNNESWAPIGSGTNYFRGTFDGNGYSITGLSVAGSEQGQGLFGSCYNATIKNLKVGGSVSNDASHAAIIAGKAWYTTIDNCEVLDGSSVTGTSGDSFSGIVGYAYECALSSCVNRADITGASLAAGIVGYTNNDSGSSSTVINCKNYGTINSGNYTGGIVGTTNSGATIIISNCYNEGDITTSSGSFAGGIIAKLYGKSGAVSTMTNCANIGAVSNSSPYTGGLAGANQGGAIYNSYSRGEVKGTSEVGGLVGIHEDNSSYGAVMDNCYTSAVVTGNSSNIGLAVGKCDDAIITACYYDSLQSVSLSAIGTDNNSQSVSTYSSLTDLLNDLNTVASSNTSYDAWQAGSDSYPTF